MGLEKEKSHFQFNLKILQKFFKVSSNSFLL